MSEIDSKLLEEIMMSKGMFELYNELNQLVYEKRNKENTTR